LKGYLYTHIHSSIVHNSQKVEASQVSINRLMNKQNVYTYNGILFSLKKEWNSDTCYTMDETWEYDIKWNKPVSKDKFCMISPNSHRQKAEGWFCGAGEERNAVFQLRRMKTVLETAQQCECN
jgi:hypothetical protein